MKDVINLAGVESCTGCGLCASICPQQCIIMKEGKQGHLFPSINDSTCIKCGLCEKCCSILHPCELKPIIQAYASWTKDNHDYRTTSSGGIATVLSKFVIGRNGVVYGCAMLPDVEVRHIRVDRVEELELLKSSKYVQSSITSIIPQLKVDISNGRKVLFIGTPCQVAAIKRLFAEQPDNLFLVDLICHGVPSLKSLKEHVGKVTKGKKVDKVVFREDGNRYVLAVYDSLGNQIYRKPVASERYRDWYMNAFLDGYTFRDSCYQCRYARPERCSDITIGDFWGLSNEAFGIPPHEYGCSVVLPITPKGLMLIEAIKPLVNLYERDVQEAVSGNSQLRHPTKLTKRVRYYRKAQGIMKSTWMYYLVNMDRIMGLWIDKTKRRIIKHI